MSKNSDIEKLFKREFIDFKPKPSSGLWGKISRELMWKSFFRPNIKGFNILHVSAILLTTIVLTSIVLIQKRKTENQKPLNTTSAITSPKDINHQSIVADAEKSKNTIIVPEVEREKTNKNITQNRIEDQKSIHDQIAPDNLTENKGPVLINRENDDVLNTANLPPRAYFCPSQTEGCTPLHINILNLSSNAEEYSWSFGDGGFSIEENPSYIYDEPGEYYITLTVSGNTKDINVFREKITVFPVPVANFVIDKENNSSEEQVVYFYNYSRGASTYDWDFGDGERSNQREPDHIYSVPGNYNVILKSISIEGCTDSLILKDVLDLRENPIKIPNAFSPNTTGPNGGYYNNNEIGNEIFHPILNETPIDYQLRVFNRKGNLIFETNDINIGWDGYYMQELQPQGVYIYKLRVRFENGENLTKIGDITLFTGGQK